MSPWPFNTRAKPESTEHSLPLLQCVMASILDYHDRQVLDPLTDGAVFNAVSDALEMGLWSATEMPEMRPKNEGRDDTQDGPGGLTRTHVLDLARQLHDLSSQPSPFADRFAGRAVGKWSSAVSAILEFQYIYDVLGSAGTMSQLRLRGAVALAMLLGLELPWRDEQFARTLQGDCPHRQDGDHTYLRTLYGPAMELWLSSQGKRAPWLPPLRPLESLKGGEPTNGIDALVLTPAQWRSLDTNRLEEVAYRGLILYGQNDGVPMLGLAGLYAVVIERLNPERRQGLRVRVVDAIEAGRTSVNALNVFMAEDPETGVVSSAALDFAVLGPSRDDPLRCPRFLFQQAAQHNWPRVRVGILQGLLLLGDGRVTGLISGCWRELPSDERLRLAMSWSGTVYVTLIDFLLDWLIEEADAAVCAAIGQNLARMPSAAVVPRVVDVERVFPVNAAPQGQPLRTLGQWTFSEYAPKLASRLHALSGSPCASNGVLEVRRAWATTV
jgi:hypothetical protein